MMVADASLTHPLTGDPASIAAYIYRLLSQRTPGLLEHSRSTGQLATMLGEHLGLDTFQLAQLRLAGEMHDLGKLDIPDAILLKPGRLDPAEWRQMQAHSVLGADRLLAVGMPADSPLVAAVRHHHESFDGSGYPDGLAGEAIPLYARIISIADSYDAIASSRTYHRARSHAEIINIMDGQRQHYDPQLLKVFYDRSNPDCRPVALTDNRRPSRRPSPLGVPG